MLAVYLDGRLVSAVPERISEQRARVLVDEAVAELGITGVVELKEAAPPKAVRKRHDGRPLVQQLPFLR